ncbi:MAG TPA: GGDEF domain-containing protein [Methylophilaceae bacterium]|nr:GGDEF domain-containing protein [Methylophilaceae bacterium]
MLHPDVNVRSMANSLLFAIVYTACARELLISVESPLKTAYWFTGISFAIFAALMWFRVVNILLVQPDADGLFIDIPLNQVSFFITSIIQLCVTFGFVLMLNYRLVLDLQKIASRDVLTGAFNRRRLEEEAERLRVRCLRMGESLAIMMIDIDDFKLINDRYGHPAGDEVLRHLVAISLASIRADDYFARYGGEEFCILLPNSTEKEALVLAERLRRTCEATTAVFNGKTLSSTVSIGVADSTSASLEFPSLVSAADQALYSAKQAGKNRVAAYSAMEEPQRKGSFTPTDDGN